MSSGRSLRDGPPRMADGALHTTALVNEVYLKLVGQREGDWQNRAHFFAIAAQVMRRILLDDARKALRQKRGRAAAPCRSTMFPPCAGRSGWTGLTCSPLIAS